MHKRMFSWDPTLGFMHYLGHLKFLEYIFGVEHEGGRMQMAEDQILMSAKV